MSLLLETLHRLQDRSPAARPLLPLADDDSPRAADSRPELSLPRNQAEMTALVDDALAEIERSAVNETVSLQEVVEYATVEAATRQASSSANMRQLAQRLIEHAGEDRFSLLLLELSGSGAPRNNHAERGPLALALAGALAEDATDDVLLISSQIAAAPPVGSADGPLPSPRLSDLLAPDFDRGRLIATTLSPRVYRIECGLTENEWTANDADSWTEIFTRLKTDFRAIIVEPGPWDGIAKRFPGLATACDATLVAIPLGSDARKTRKALTRVHRLHAPRVACVAITG